jgi:hypothetical protein
MERSMLVNRLGLSSLSYIPLTSCGLELVLCHLHRLAHITNITENNAKS